MWPAKLYNKPTVIVLPEPDHISGMVQLADQNENLPELDHLPIWRTYLADRLIVPSKFRWGSDAAMASVTSENPSTSSCTAYPFICRGASTVLSPDPHSPSASK